MTIQINFELDLIAPNPFQVRTEEDQEHIQSVAASIEAHGLLQIPTGRKKPGDPKMIELAFGHTRLAAFRLLFSGARDDEALEALIEKRLDNEFPSSNYFGEWSLERLNEKLTQCGLEPIISDEFHKLNTELSKLQAGGSVEEDENEEQEEQEE